MTTDISTLSMTKARDPDWYQRTLEIFKLLLNTQPGGPGFITWYEEWGIYSIVIVVNHIEYLRELDSALAPVGAVFDIELIHRWKIVNDLLIAAYQPVEPVPREALHR